MLAAKTPGSRSSAPSKALGSPAGELQFRIQGGQHDGRTVRISAAKCTIGSAAGCTLRLRAGDVDPLHCLILCGHNGTVIRRNSRRTYLNGAPFDDAPLQAGDLLQIASIELVVVACPQAGAQLPQRTEAIREDRPSPAGQREVHVDEIAARARQDAQEEIRRLETEQEEQRLEQSRLEHELAEVSQQLCHAREQALELQTRLADREAGEDPDPKLQSLSQALEKAREEISELQALRCREDEQWTLDREQIEKDRSALAARLRELEQEARQHRAIAPSTEAAQLAQAQLQESARRCQLLEQELDDARRQIDEVHSRENEAQASEEQIERWQAEAHQWQLQAEQVTKELSELREARARLEEKVAELQVATQARPQTESQRKEIDAARRELDLARQQLQDEQAQLARQVSEFAPREKSLAQSEAQLREREAAWETDRQQQAAALEERSHLIAQQIEQFEAERAAFARQQTALIQQMTSLEDRVQELTAANGSRGTNSPFVVPRPDEPSLLGEMEPADQPYARAQAEQGAAKEESAPQKPKYTPPSFLAQAAELARQEELAIARGETPPGLGKANEPMQTLVMPAQPSSAQQEDSIENYMAKLLSRVRGSEESRETPSPDAAGKQAEAATGAAAVPAPEVEEPIQPQPIVRRVPVPEPPERLSQMRELANSAARSAIDTHAKKHGKREVKRRSLVALLSGIGAVGLGVAFLVTGSMPAVTGSLAFAVVCAFMSLRAIQHSLRQMRLRPPGEIPSDDAVPAPAPATEGVSQSAVQAPQ